MRVRQCPPYASVFQQSDRFLSRIGGVLITVLAAIPVTPVEANPPGYVIEDRPFWQDFHTPYPLATDAENDVRAIATDGQGRVWAATGAGVRYLEDGIWRMPVGAEKMGPTFSLRVDRAGRVWVGAWDGLYIASSKRIEKAVGIPAVPVTALAEDAEASNASVLYVASPDGIWRGNGGTWEKLGGVWANTIRAVRVQPGGNLWIATAGGLYRFDVKSSAQPAALYSRPSEILSSNVTSLAADANGRLHVGGSGGIDVFDSMKRVASFTVKNGMPNRSVRALAFDADGRLWAVTRLGVARREKGRWSLRHSRRWLLNDDARDVAIASDGTAWVATGAGVSAIGRKRWTLAEKADYYLQKIRMRHIRPPGLISQAVITTPGSLANTFVGDTDNDGQYTGVYCTAESYRYAVTGASEARANAQEAFHGLESLQTVTGTPHFVARTMIAVGAQPRNDLNRNYTPEERAEERAKDIRYKPVEERWLRSADGKWLWKRDTSSDEIVGHMLAYAVYHDLAADAEEKKRVAALVGRIMGGIVDNGFVLKDIDGQATRWGVWTPERLNSDFDWREERPNNSIEILSHLRVASRLTGDPKFEEARRLLIEKHGYARNALLAGYGTPSERTHITDELLAFTFPNLIGYETDAALRRTFQAGMRTWFRVVKRDGIPLYDFVYARFSGARIDLNGSADTLREWPMDLIEWTVDNREREDVERDRTPGTDEGFLTRILPRSEMGITTWDQEPYKAVIGNGGITEDKNDAWLFAYWAGRYYGLISPPRDR